MNVNVNKQKKVNKVNQPRKNWLMKLKKSKERNLKETMKNKKREKDLKKKKDKLMNNNINILQSIRKRSTTRKESITKNKKKNL